MKSFRDMNPYLVGTISVLLLAAGTGIAFAVGILGLLEDRFEMEGVFTDASGLRAGDDVRVAGVSVGAVTGLEIDRTTGSVVVTWEVDRGVEVGNESGAEIALASLLGAKYVKITQPARGEVSMEELPRAQRVVPLERTTVPFDLFELTRVATEGIEELDTEGVNELLTDLADITEGKAATVADLTDGITRVGRAINQRDAQFDALLDQADRLSATLADKDDELLALLDASDRILDLVVTRRNDLALLLGETAETVQELDRIVSTHKERLDASLDTLHETLDVVDRQQDDLDAALAWLGPAFLQQSRSGGQGPWQDIFVRGLGPDVVESLQDVYGVLLGTDG